MLTYEQAIEGIARVAYECSEKAEKYDWVIATIYERPNESTRADLTLAMLRMKRTI